MKYSFVFALGITLLLASCTKIPYILLRNHAGRSLQVSADDVRYQVPPDGVLKIMFPNSQTLSISSESGHSWNYKTCYPTKEFMNGTLFRVQVETNGLIYVVWFTNETAVKEFPVQPIGFPWPPNMDTLSHTNVESRPN
jgi:hypothetical protein